MNQKISDLSNASALVGNELIEVVQGGVNKKTTPANIANLYAIPPAAQRSGTSIAFDTPATYGYTAAENGPITLDLTDFKEGVTQLLIHNDDSNPFDDVGTDEEFKIIGGTYIPSVANLIYMHAVKPTIIHVTISQYE